MNDLIYFIDVCWTADKQSMAGDDISCHRPPRPRPRLPRLARASAWGGLEAAVAAIRRGAELEAHHRLDDLTLHPSLPSPVGAMSVPTWAGRGRGIRLWRGRMNHARLWSPSLCCGSCRCPRTRPVTFTPPAPPPPLSVLAVFACHFHGLLLPKVA
jgi:hypothetical protein